MSKIKTFIFKSQVEQLMFLNNDIRPNKMTCITIVYMATRFYHCGKAVVFPKEITDIEDKFRSFKNINFI